MARPASVWGIHDWSTESGAPSGCGYYRIMAPLAELARHGWKTGCKEFEPPPGALEGVSIVAGQRLDKFEALGSWRKFRLKHRLVYDIDDDLWNISPVNWQAYRSFNRVSREAVAACAETADLVTVSTEPLVPIMAQYNRNVMVVPNCVPGWLLTHERPRRDKVVVGWAGGASHGEDIAMISSAVRKVLHGEPSAELHVYGTDYRPSLGGTGRYTDWVSVSVDERGYFGNFDFDIGLAPLTQNVFNESKCVDSSMRISTNTGVIPAGLIEPGMKVWRDGWREVQAVEHSDPRPGLRVTTARGLQVAITPEHRLMHADGEWRHAQDLAVGDVLQLVAEECADVPYHRVAWPADGRITRAGDVEPLAFLDAPEGPSVRITETWGRLLGIFTGDGCMSGKTAISISCDGQDADLIKQIISDFESVGLKATTEAVTTYDGQVLRRRSVRVSNSHLSRFLAGIGAAQPHSTGWQRWERTLRVPDAIFRSPHSVRAAFLAGLFEADGHNTRSGVAMTTKSADLAADTQRLLWSIGIPSIASRMRGPQRSPYADRIYWQLKLRRREAELFAEHVGFLSGRKQAKLAENMGRKPSNAVHPLRWVDEITSIDPCEVSPVDIQVDGEAFSAAGILSHNSALKALEYAALGIPVIASNVTPYRDFVVHGETGYLARSKADWVRYLRDLIRDDAAREEMGKKARERARAHVIEVGWTRWADAYKTLL